MDNLMLNRLKEIRQLQNDIKSNELDDNAESGKIIILVKFHCLLYFQEIYTQNFYQ